MRLPLFEEKVNYQGVIHDETSIDTYFTQNRNVDTPYNENEFY